MHDSMADKAQGRLDAVKIANETAEIDPAPKKTVVKKAVRSKKPTKEVIAQKNMTASTKVATSKKTSNKAAPKSGKTS